jgi:L-ascorbate peroxidase
MEHTPSYTTTTVSLLRILQCDSIVQFDNSYYASVPEDDEDLLKLETDTALFADEKMRPIALKYKNDQEVFFTEYAAAHKKLSELGSKFEPAEGIKI